MSVSVQNCFDFFKEEDGSTSATLFSCFPFVSHRIFKSFKLQFSSENT